MAESSEPPIAAAPPTAEAPEVAPNLGEIEYQAIEGDLVEAEASSTNFSTHNLSVDTESDSALGDVGDFVSSTASLQSTLYEHVEENGRTYHKYKEGSYLLPNDDVEQDRLDLQHHLCKLTLHGRSHLAPIKKDPQNVLDFGTGTGIWAIEFAQEYPSANVLGTDLSPIQPLYVPPNCRFEVDDAEDDWLYKEKFDYIHGRLMCTCLKNPPAVFQKAFHSCTPGGYFEMFEISAQSQCIDNSLEGTALQKYSNMMLEGGRYFGKDFTHAPRYKSYMEAAGFVDVVEKQFQWPSNTWPRGKYFKTLGMWFNQDMQQGLSGIAMATFTRALGMSREEVEKFVIEVRNDMNDKRIHAYIPVYVVYGRKPQ